jgi:hypothetical protein
MQVFNYWVCIADFKGQELKNWDNLDILECPINITRMCLLFFITITCWKIQDWKTKWWNSDLNID